MLASLDVERRRVQRGGSLMLAWEYDGSRGRIDQADRADVPERVANLYQAQVTQPGRNLEAGAAHRLSVQEPVWL